MDDGGADAACDGCEHSSRESLHENEMKQGHVEGRREAE
jgi:hypothetical protein